MPNVDVVKGPETARCPVSPVNWSELVERIERGEESGLEELYHIFRREVRYYVCRRIGWQELDDKVHDTFLAIVHAIQNGQSHTLLSHTVSESGSYTAIALEPVVGRDIDPAGRYNLSEAMIAYAPGTKLNSAASWKIGNFGYWERFQLE